MTVLESICEYGGGRGRGGHEGALTGTTVSHSWNKDFRIFNLDSIKFNSTGSDFNEFAG